MIRHLILIAAAFLLSGCFQSDTRSTTQATTHTTHAVQGSVVVPVTIADGTVHPVPVAVDLTVTSDSATDTSGQSQTKTSIDPAMIGALVSAMKGAFPALGVVGSILTAGSQAAGWSNETVGTLAGTAGTLLLAAGGAYMKSRNDQRAKEDALAQAAAHKADADEAWAVVKQAAQTPPKV